MNNETKKLWSYRFGIAGLVLLRILLSLPRATVER